ncbi:MAG: hypothetical protein Q8O32_03300, partial [bacterium]|nr:hypothetical protein [bacterium]
NYNALLVDYKNPAAWRDAFMRLSKDKKLVGKLIINAHQEGCKYSWAKRAMAIENFIFKNT